MTHQAPSSVIASFVFALSHVFVYQTDGRTPYVNITTSYSGIGAWWVNNCIIFINNTHGIYFNRSRVHTSLANLVTHQAQRHRQSLVCFVCTHVRTCSCTYGQTYVRTPPSKLMTTYDRWAEWIKTISVCFSNILNPCEFVR